MQRKTAFRVGLTGGIGSGKSTVAAILARKGATVIDADAISRGTTAVGGSAIPAIAAEFGAACIQPDGAMDRNRMRAIIFSDPAAKGRLERIIHPIVGREVQAGIALAEGANSPLIVIEIPLLVESGRWRALLHRILVVDCSIDEQVKRVVQRSGLDETEVTRIISAQAGRDARLAAADVVIFNQHLSLGELHDHVDQIGSQLGI